MISTDYAELIDAATKRGITNISNLETLTRVVIQCTVYKFRRKQAQAWQYEIVMPGYGHEPNKSKWIEVKTYPPIIR